MSTRKESTSDIVVNVGDEEVVVESLSVTKNVDVEAIYGSGRVFPDGYAIHQVSYEGTMTCAGNRQDLNSKFFDVNGIPEVLDSISITHLNGELTEFHDILVTSEGYEVNTGETTETTYQFIAMRKGVNGNVDTQPSR
jgi:hypothetical protein